MRHEVTAPMSGTVWRVLTGVGEPVEAGAELLILEAMKMEIPVVTPSPGNVTQLDVSEGDAVVEGQVVAVVSTEEAT